MILAFCESVHAGGASKWHLRRLDEAGPKLGGGVTTPSLCGAVRKPWGGWDVAVPLTRFHLENNTCPRCLEALAQR